MSIIYGDMENLNTICPVCRSDIYIDKQRGEFKCMNSNCKLNWNVIGIGFNIINNDINKKVGEVEFKIDNGEIKVEVKDGK